MITEHPVKAERRTVVLCDGLSVDGYRMPNGEFRVGIQGASELIGFRENWLRRTLQKESGTVGKALQGLGFTGETKKVVHIANGCKQYEAATISLRDLNRLISYAVGKGKKEAQSLQIALTELSLNDFWRDAFGDRPLTIEEKRALFYQTYSQSLSSSDWRAMDLQDIVDLSLPGDEPHLRNALWNNF